MSEPAVVLDDLDLQGIEDSGVWWMVPNGGIEGWWDSSASTATLTQRARANGAWTGDAWLTARSVAISGVVGGPDHASVEGALHRLMAANGLDERVLTIGWDTYPLSAKVRRTDKPIVTWLNGLTASWSVQMAAADPRKMAAPLTASTPLPSTTGGLSIPFTIPFLFSAVTVSGTVALTNPGNIAGPVTLRIDGPVTAPTVTHVSSGRSLVFASSMSLGAGEFVTVDMERREVLAQGVEPRNAWVTKREWSQFEPGGNIWAFSAGTASAALLTVTATPAWM